MCSIISIACANVDTEWNNPSLNNVEKWPNIIWKSEFLKHVLFFNIMYESSGQIENLFFMWVKSE